MTEPAAERTETGPARKGSTERCANPDCGHTKRDHSGRRDHATKHPDIPLRPWCHACETDCLFEPAAVPVPPADQTTDRVDELANLRTMYDAASAREHELIEERDSLGREADRLRKDWVEMRARAEEAEARATAMEHAMESTAADALKHRGCHRDLMAQCQRAERAEAEAERLRADRAAILTEAADVGEDVANRIHAGGDDHRAGGAYDVVDALRRMAAEAQPTTKPETESCAHCGKTVRRITGTLSVWWVHVPGGQAFCYPWQPASSPRATPQPAAGARQDGAQPQEEHRG